MSPAASSSLERRLSAEPSVVVKNVNGRRMVSRTNPEISYAYGAPASGKTATRKRRLTQEAANVDEQGTENDDELDDNADASTSAAPDAKARYQALKKRKLQEAKQQQPQSPSATRKSPRKAQDTTLASMIRNHSQASQEARKHPGGAASLSDDLSSNARRQRLSSPGRSRGFVHGQLNSFYMDRQDGDTEDDIVAVADANVPSSILLGAQRQGHDFVHGRQATDMDSIHSSDLHDSRVRDYTELQREADLFAGGEREKGVNKLNGKDAALKSGNRSTHAVDAALAALNGIAEGSDAEHSATEDRKHTQRSDIQEQSPKRKQFRSPPRPTISKTPVPIRRHSAPRSFSLFTSLALLGALITVVLSIYRGVLLDPIVSAFPSDATIGDAALRKRIQMLESRLSTAEKSVSVFEGQLDSAKRLADQVADTVRTLPGELNALQAEAKKAKGADLDVKLIDQLKRVFVQKGDKIDGNVDDKTLEVFHKESEKTLRKLNAELFSQERQRGNVIGRSALVEHLTKELNSLKAGLEARFNANAQEMQNDILSKVRQQQDMYERAGSWRKGDDRKSGSAEKAMDNLSEAHESLRNLIDDALEVFAADRIGERDFALYTAGGRVVPSLTSASYAGGVKRSASSLPLLGWFGGGGRAKTFDRLGSGAGAQGQPPVIALVPDNTPGMCWAFDGAQGTLGISLARRVVVTKISLEHTPASISHESGSSAPRDVIVWGIVERPSDLKRLQTYRSQDDRRADEDFVSPAPAPPSDRHIALASFTYDVSAARAVQTFTVTRQANDLEIPINVVQVQVLSNHGKDDFTCLYRVRIHGREWTLEDEAGTT